MSDAAEKSDQGVGPDKTPDPTHKNTTTPDHDQDQSAPIPFAHDGQAPEDPAESEDPDKI